MSKIIRKMVYYSLKQAAELSDEAIVVNINQLSEIIGTIETNLIYINYYECFKNIFEWIANIFFCLLISNHLINGNKRFTLSFIVEFLYFSGYYLFYTKGERKNYKKYENIMSEWIFRHADEKDNKSLVGDKIKKEMLKIILSNICIALNFK